MSDRMIDRISKLLAQAEGASTEHEAAAFMERAQDLATRNSIDLARARQHQADKTKREEPTDRTVKIAQGWKVTMTEKWLTELYLGVAAANDLKCLIAKDASRVYPHGFPSDMDVAEALYNSLAVQMVSAADAALKAGANKGLRTVPKQKRVEIPDEERAWGEYIDEDAWNSTRRYADSQASHERWGEPLPPKWRLEDVRDDDGRVVMEERKVSLVDGRVFRANFYEAYVASISDRLWAAKRKAEREIVRAERLAIEAAEGDTTVSTGTEMVLRDKKQEVKDYYDEQVGKMKLRGSHSGPTVKQSSGLGRFHGQQAAEKANLGLSAEVGSGAKRAIG